MSTLHFYLYKLSSVLWDGSAAFESCFFMGIVLCSFSISAVVLVAETCHRTRHLKRNWRGAGSRNGSSEVVEVKNLGYQQHMQAL